jgi:hypothetical protein
MAFEQTSLTNTPLAATGIIVTVKEDVTGPHVFWVAEDGSLKHRLGGGNSFFGLQRGKWEEEETIYQPGSKITGGVAALSRCQGHCEVFWVAGSSIMAAFRDGNKKWTTWTLPLGNYTCDLRSNIAAVSKSDRSMDIYWISAQGTVCTASYDANAANGWTNIFSISNPGAARPDSTMVAITRHGMNHRQVFWTTPQQGIQAAYSDDKGSRGYSVYEVAPTCSVAFERGSIYALSSHNSRIALWWITPEGAVMCRHSAQSASRWSDTHTIAGVQERAYGALTAVDRRPSSDDLCYEVAWTRKDRKIGSAKMTKSSDNTPTAWVLQTLVAEASVDRGALACVLENINFVTLIYSGGDGSFHGESKLLFGNWLEAGTAPAVARSNLIQHGPALKSHLNVTLQGYHQVVAVSQANINATLKYHFENDDRLLQFKYQDKPSEDEWETKFEGVLSAPTVRLLDRPNGLDAAIFCVNFESGTFSKFSRKLKKYDMAGWTIAFTVSFGKKDLGHLPDDMKDIRDAGSYSATQLLIDFGTAELSSFSWMHSSMPPLKTDKDGDNTEMGAIEEAMKTYIRNQLSSTGSHNVLGYALKVKEGVDPPATFTPKLFRLQVVDSKPIDGVELSDQKLQNRNAFCFTEMTGKKNEVVKFPDADLKWSGNWFYGSVQGTYALTRRLFLEQFVVTKLGKYNEQIMDVANEMWHRSTNPECNNFDWALSKGGKPGADRFKWNVVERNDEGHSSAGDVFKVFGLSNIFDRATGRIAAAFSWSERWDRNKGGADYLWAESQVCNTLSWNPGCGWLTIETSMTLIDSRTEYAILKSLLIGPSIDNKVSTVNIVFTTNIILSNIEDGKLKVVVDIAPPTVKANVSSWTTDALKRLFSGDPTQRNADLAHRIRDKVRSVLQAGAIRDKLQNELENVDKFVFPGGGTFRMKDAIFNNAGDLTVALTYVLKNGTIVGDEGDK